MKTSSFTLNERLIFAVLTLGLWLKIIYTQFSIKINKTPIFSEDNASMFFMNLWSVLAVMFFLYLISYKRRLLLPIIGAVLLGFIVFADTLYGRYYYNPVSISIFSHLYMADDVMQSALTLFKWKDIIFIMDFFVLSLLLLSKKYLPTIVTRKTGSGVRNMVLSVIVLVTVGFFTIGHVSADKSRYAFEHKYIAADLGLLYYHGNDVVKTVERSMNVKELDVTQRTKIKEANQYMQDGPNVYTGASEGYNLIVIQMEAMMNFLIDYEVEGQAVTPFLNSLKEESLYLSNNFIQTANGNTVDAELMMNTSLLPIISGTVNNEYPTNTFRSLPYALENNGYISNSFHSYEAGFWNREIMHRTLGFNKFYSYDDFVQDEQVGWALSDQSLFRQALDFTKDEAGNQPFYSMIITLSSHYPYDAFVTGPFSEVAATDGLLNHYYNAASYVDQAISEFVSTLKEEGLYENTLLVIYGDHGGLFNEHAVQQTVIDDLVYTSYNWMKYQQVPVIIHASDIFSEGLRIDDVSGQLDIMPTVANLLGLEDLYTLGSDVLSPDYQGLVVKRYGDVITSDFIYSSDEAEVYDYETGEILLKADYRDQIMKAHEKLAMNDLILSGDYFKEFMK